MKKNQRLSKALQEMRKSVVKMNEALGRDGSQDTFDRSQVGGIFDNARRAIAELEFHNRRVSSKFEGDSE